MWKEVCYKCFTPVIVICSEWFNYSCYVGKVQREIISVTILIMMTIQVLKVANAREVNPFLFLDTSMAPETACFCISDSPSRDCNKATDRVVALGPGAGEFLRICLSYLDL